MKQVRRSWAGSTVTLVLLSFFLTGCPKRPEVAETAPKAIGPQGAIGMPAPPPAPPPTVSAVPPTVTAPEGESPTEVTTQSEKAEAAPEAKIQEAETPPTQEAQVAPEAGGAPGPQASEDEVKRGAQIKEAEVKPEAEIKEPEVKLEAPAPATEAEVKEVKPETSAQVKEAEVSHVTEGQVKGGEVGAPGVTPPPAGEPSAAGASAAAPVEPVAPAPVPTPLSPPPAPVVVAEAPKALELVVKDIYFDFDQAVIREDSRKALADNIQWFKANAAATVTIEGHCDERGSSEYNLALGERRARVTRDFLVTAGIEAKRINTISFGKERPFVLGHDETAWKWNRRAHFISTTK